jgi:arylsulfatase A-like enzyme
MTRREWLLAAGAAAAPASAAGARPNIVVLLGDQLRAQAVGCLGDEQAQTPHIDRLAREGVTLSNTFANTPVCCPARAAMLTGQYCHRNGMTANDLRLREGGVSLARILGGAGYRTGFVGKWHLDGGPRLPGFVPPGPRRQGYEYWAANECSHEHFRNTVFRDTPEPIVLTEFETAGYAKFAEEFVRASRTDARPFYLTVQWGPPHDPYRAPEEWARRFDGAAMKLRPNWREGAGVPGRAAIAQYYAMTAALDDGIGRVLRAIDEAGARENTIVLVSSDHGDMLGSQGARLKRKPWEESVRVPGIVRWPARLKAGTRRQTMFTHVDFAPTLLGMAGVAAPRAMQGTNLARAIAGEGRGAESAYFQIFGPYAGDGTEAGWRGVRTERYMYARYRERPWVLYDVERDPYEMRNLVEDRGARGLLGEMEKKLGQWMARTGDGWDYNWTFPVEDAGRLYKDRTYYSVGEYLAGQ